MKLGFIIYVCLSLSLLSSVRGAEEQEGGKLKLFVEVTDNYRQKAYPSKHELLHANRFIPSTSQISADRKREDMGFQIAPGTYEVRSMSEHETERSCPSGHEMSERGRIKIAIKVVEIILSEERTAWIVQSYKREVSRYCKVKPG